LNTACFSIIFHVFYSSCYANFIIGSDIQQSLIRVVEWFAFYCIFKKQFFSGF